MEKKKIIKFISYIIISVLVGVTVVYAGEFLTPPGPPAKSMKSLADLSELVKTGANTPNPNFITPSTVVSTMTSLEETYGLLKEKITAIKEKEEDIKNGVTIFGVVGTMPDKTGLSAASTSQSQTEGVNYFTVPKGYYDGTAAKVSATDVQVAALDADIKVDNIKNGVTIFGVTGSLTSLATGIPKTGQATSYLANDDGSYHKGFIGTRLVDNGGITITDSATGLMWMKCSVGQSGTGCATGGATVMDWATAISTCEADSTAGYFDWRLPNIFELFSILNFESGPAWTVLVDSSFFPATDTTKNYWTSTTYNNSTGSAFGVSFVNAGVATVSKTATSPTRCVR